jgi:hypothetical protein
METEVFARCAHPQTNKCRAPQPVTCPDHKEGHLTNHCRYCHGRLVELSREELRALLDARNNLKGGA